MFSTCTSSSAARRRGRAFTLIELMVGITMAAGVALAIAPVWLSWEKTGDGVADQTIWFLQSRVALARFERDLRLASAKDCRFGAASPILEAGPSQVVLLQPGSGGSPPVVVEWEIVKGSLMRRWGICPDKRPAVFAHTVYPDSKTMLEGVAPGSRFVYQGGILALASPVPAGQLDVVTRVALELRGRVIGAPGDIEARASALVGR